MPNRRISADLKMAALRLFTQNHLDVPTICGACGFSERTFWRVLALYRETGSPVQLKMSQRRGRPRIMIHEDIEYLLRLVRANPSYFLDELLSLLRTNRFISVHFTTIFRTLERCNISRKKLRSIAAERNESRRSAYILHMAQYDAEEIGFIDEVSKDGRTPNQAYALLTVNGIDAAMVVQNGMNREKFLEFLQGWVVRV
ncbi:hypothetical protein K488DRAFT_62611 [Vararia minispora EC-137]|uniref:Uncharacterized protein n=1 Tax=Vararia minispora EC-137 TaxID=1314806 RepID=A0ACB8Q6V2_9AGAM|nr:hypothetical protein K488DRAFT_62611 [Vararia minispora EC-137]